MAKKVTTTDKWTDSVGQEFSPGDYVAVATISGRSPQMVVAQVVSLNTHNSRGELNTKGWGSSGDPTVTVTALPIHDGRGFIRWGAFVKYDSDTGEWLVDKKKIKKVTYQFVENIIKLTEDQIANILKEKDDE